MSEQRWPEPVYLTKDHAINMTLRDDFAGKAMQAQVGNPLKMGEDEAHRLIAERAYRLADAMLKAREK
jgi:hypothetical protein